MFCLLQLTVLHVSFWFSFYCSTFFLTFSPFFSGLFLSKHLAVRRNLHHAIEKNGNTIAMYSYVHVNFAFDKFTLNVHNKRKIKHISPKCVLFHILFGKFVKLTALNVTTWCARYLDSVIHYIWAAIFFGFLLGTEKCAHRMTKKRKKNGKEVTATKQRVSQYFVLIAWGMTMIMWKENGSQKKKGKYNPMFGVL